MHGIKKNKLHVQIQMKLFLSVFGTFPKLNRDKKNILLVKKKLFQISIMLITSNIMSNKRFVIELL